MFADFWQTTLLTSRRLDCAKSTRYIQRLQNKDYSQRNFIRLRRAVCFFDFFELGFGAVAK